MTKLFGMMTGLLLMGISAVLGFAMATNGGQFEPLSFSDPVVEESQTDESGGFGEGIQVHGDWTIEIRDPDGTLVDRHEFQNALTSNGATLLSDLLGRNVSAGLWVVTLSGPVGSKACLNDSDDSEQWCVVTEAASGPSVSWYHKTLTVDVPAAGSNADKLVLSGTMTAQRVGTIDEVATRLWACDATDAPSSPCESGPLTEVTSTMLSPAVDVALNQQVAVTVVISFS